ncbi:hypothetical protein [Streptomyces sp. NPDC048361]|uniref:hypothetical protein n=1 Tax=Streptomyces sp. NPDC048361 TaxID=3154720 RepID=UPI0034180A9D
MAARGRKSRAKAAPREGTGKDVTDTARPDQPARAAREADQVKANVKQARADIEGRPRTDGRATRVNQANKASNATKE